MSLFEDFFADLTQPVEVNEFEDLPRLDFDTSTLTSSALSVDHAVSAPSYLEGIPVDLTVDSIMNDHQVPMLTKSD